MRPRPASSLLFLLSASASSRALRVKQCRTEAIRRACHRRLVRVLSSLCRRTERSTVSDWTRDSILPQDRVLHCRKYWTRRLAHRRHSMVAIACLCAHYRRCGLTPPGPRFGPAPKGASFGGGGAAAAAGHRHVTLARPVPVPARDCALSPFARCSERCSDRARVWTLPEDSGPGPGQGLRGAVSASLARAGATPSRCVMMARTVPRQGPRD